MRLITLGLGVMACLVGPVAAGASSRAEPGSTGHVASVDRAASEDRVTSGIGAVGELHGVAHTPSAAVRDAGHSDRVRYTVWYPAQRGAEEAALTLGPPGEPLFLAGSSALDAPIAAGRWPVLLLSHGNGGTARMMGWFGTAMARAGYVVVAVDHPGNNGVDAMTAPGSILMWNRVDDLSAAWTAVQADPRLSDHVDATRLGLVGYSAGGYTALVSAGARPDMARLVAFCKEHPQDGVCAPQLENPEFTFERRMALAAAPQLAPWVATSGQDRRIPNVRAVFLMAPAIVQAFEPAQLAQLRVPVSVVVGAADDVAAPATNSTLIKSANANTHLQVLPGVGHYDFLSACTDLGRQRVGPLCESRVERSATHEAAIEQATTVFRNLQAGEAAPWQAVETTGSSQARHESSAVVIGDQLYVVGGRGERALQALDLTTRSWRTLAPPPLELHHAQAATHAGKLLIITGFTGGFPDETPLANVLVYDPAADRWAVGAEIPAARRRGAAGVAVEGDVAYVVGGNAKGHNDGYVAWTDAFNIATGEWKALADAPHARDHFHAVAANGHVYATAGRESSHNTGESFSRTVKAVDVYDIARNTWRTLPSPIPTPRAGTSAVAQSGKVIVLGGESGSQTQAHDEVEMLDPATGRWSSLPSLRQGRHGFQAGVHRNAVVVAAGSANRGGGPELNSVEVRRADSE